jgi:hypothetical protein
LSAANAAANMPQYLALPGPRVCLPVRVMFDAKALTEAVRRGAGQVRTILEQAPAFISKQEFRPHQFTNSGNGVGC